MMDTRTPVVESPLKKKAYHHGDLRNAIIAEAIARARVDGEKAIVLREIAPQLGVSATAAYRHFTNRQQLVEEVSAQGFLTMAEHVMGAQFTSTQTDPVLAAYVSLRNASIAMVDFTAAEPDWAQMMIATIDTSEPVSEAARQVQTVLQEIVDGGIESGVFKPETTVRGSRVYWAGIDGLCSHAMFRVLPMDTPEAQRATSRTIDLCMTDLLTERGVRARDAAQLPDGIVTELPR